ncbi:MAG: nickel pincer cofactor biosynthesis protein LarC [Candidatus Methanoperedens sp.]|nr:nickel pincer cofactor biosynthesis protein LarC [Candidatus Methanoperedens sp.]
MKAILFDPFCGASGDMTIGALIDLGADARKIKDAMELAASVDVEISRTNRKGISACCVDVSTKKEGSMTLNGIVDRISSIDLPPAVISDAISVFNILANAEAKIHGTTIEKLHFHELGQEDAIADIIGACTAFHDLGLKDHRIFCSPISVGMGFIEFSHGKFPVPAPAALEILKEYSLPWQMGPVEGELLTPTGAALLAYFVNETGGSPAIKTEAIGYGAGSRDFHVPNVLRIIKGEVDDSLISDMIEMLETNVDDVTGQVLSNLIEVLMDAGARDVSIIPATMKKGRSGHIIQVIAKPQDSSRLARKIIEETGSLGVRIIPIKHRLIARREMDKVSISLNGKEFQISVKVARDLRGALLNISAEFDECKKVSQESGIPVRDVIRVTEEEARKNFSSVKAQIFRRDATKNPCESV